MFAFVTTPVGAVLFALMHGAAWGTRVPLVTAMRADYFGRAAYAQVMGFSAMVMMAGMTGGPLFGGFLRDATGSYTVAFVILSALAAAGSLAMLSARKPAPPGARPAG